MAKDWAKPFYRSAAWRKCRAAYAASVHHLCERCGGPGTEVHHRQELTPDNIHDPAVALSWDNLELLCHACHDKTKRQERRSTQDGLTFGPDGQLVAAPPIRGQG